MADALISLVVEQLASYVGSEITLVKGTREQAQKLKDNLEMVQAVLADADQKQVKSEAVRLWLDNLKQVVYYADDVLDEWLTRDAISQRQSEADVASGSRKKVLSYFLPPCFCFKNVTVRYDIGHQIKDINEQLDVIAKQRTDHGLKVVEVNQTIDESRLLTSSVVDASKIHGRDKAKDDIINRIFAESSSQGTALRVISIVGVGGLGKTTLARLIFNDEKVVEVFKTKMWVCVSDPFNLVGVAKAIIKEAGGHVPSSNVWQEVHTCLCDSVKGKLFLLVLDDVWSENPNHWNQLKLALDGSAFGSRIIVTTRNQSVAKKMGSLDHDIHELEKLSDDDSWLVMRDVALVGKEKDLEMFTKIGKEIATKCKGIPLAITILASLLCERQTKQEWKDVLSSDMWKMEEIKNFLTPSLLLSYYSLGPISKQCFLYCAVFPKDYKMSKAVLIRLWTAQGFFGYKECDLEKNGEDHFRVLAMRSFFQDFKKDSNGDITHCKMHDLVHDFAMYLSQYESCYLQNGDTISNSDKIRHLFKADYADIPKAKSLRTLFLGYTYTVQGEMYGKLTCLRTLDMRRCALEVLPNEVENLVHLRYLDLSGTKLLELPETVCNLYNLQFLGLESCSNLHKLPTKIEKLRNLRHLDIEETNALSHFPKSFGKLSSLRSLCKFIVSGGDHECKIGDLQRLNNLGGVLKLKGLSQVTDEEDATRADLKRKKYLRELTFDFKEEGGSGVRSGMKNVLDRLVPHEGLEILEIRDYSDSHFPGWVGSCSSLASVVSISLTRCRECIELPAFGNLAYLKTLVIMGMISLMRMGQEFYGSHETAFPKLELLVIEDMEKLEEWEVPISKDTKIMPLLVEIRLELCPKLKKLPGLGRLESLEKLKMRSLNSVGYIGNEFYGFVDGDSSLGVEMITFPKLKKLEVEYFVELEKWEVPVSKDRKIMPLLVNIELKECRKLRVLPCLGMMESLEKLRFEILSSVKHIGNEFYGFDCDSSSWGVEMIAFPKLRELEIKWFDELEEWEIPTSKEDRKIMPLLSQLELRKCYKLRALPRVWRMEALEVLKLSFLESVKGVGVEFADGDNEDLGVTFPKLRNLDISWMPNLEEWSIPLITPCLKKLRFSYLPAVKRLPTFHECAETLKSLEIEGMKSWKGQEKIVIINDSDKAAGSSSVHIRKCPKLRVVPEYLFSPSIVELGLTGDVGVLFGQVHANNLCSLTKLILWELPHSRLPKGFGQLKALQSLEFRYCRTLDFDLKELAHFTQLRHLDIFGCPLLEERFKGGDGWRTILAHVPKITISLTETTQNNS